MFALAIESSSSRASVSINQDGKIICTRISENPKTHSEFLNLSVQEMLIQQQIELSDIDVFACSTGPGSFTGIRVGSSIVKSFSMLFKKPIFCINSLHLLSKNDSSKKHPVLCMMNAHKNMMYVAMYESDRQVIKPIALTIDEIEPLLSSRVVTCIGDAYSIYKPRLSSSLLSLFHRNSQTSDYPSSEILSQMAIEALHQGKTIEWNLYNSLYIRDSEAEEAMRQKTLKK